MSSDNEPSTDYPPPGADLDGQAAAANLLGIRGSGQLRRREYRETSVRALEIVTGRVEIARTGDFLEWSAIHAHLFGRIYEWAGMPRAVTMSKDGRPFLQPRHFAVQVHEGAGGVRDQLFALEAGPVDGSNYHAGEHARLLGTKVPTSTSTDGIKARDTHGALRTLLRVVAAMEASLHRARTHTGSLPGQARPLNA